LANLEKSFETYLYMYGSIRSWFGRSHSTYVSFYLFVKPCLISDKDLQGSWISLRQKMDGIDVSLAELIIESVYLFISLFRVQPGHAGLG